MLRKHKNKLIYFDEGLLALKYEEANLLKGWYFLRAVKGEIAQNFEVLDLQRNTIVHSKNKVQIAMREKRNEAFIFFACKN